MADPLTSEQQWSDGADGEFWSANQPGFKFTTERPGTRAFYEAVERHRYALEPHILDIVDFPRFAGKTVLEAGCGVATDGARFARSGARYTGLDFTDAAVDLARKRFELEGLEGSFVHAAVTDLPFPDEAFDAVYSHGVIHHVADTDKAVAEFRRVLRPGGTALVMVYHRDSLNYWVNIMAVRRLFALGLLMPGGTRLMARATGEATETLEAHRDLLRRHGSRYLLDNALFLSRNTDGPGNPLSKVYSRAGIRRLFEGFDVRRVEVRFLNLRVYPQGERLAATRIARRLERRIGWHLYIEATKPRNG